jgi:ABC-type transporter Mla MlaB component
VTGPAAPSPRHGEAAPRPVAAPLAQPLLILPPCLTPTAVSALCADLADRLRHDPALAAVPVLQVDVSALRTLDITVIGALAKLRLTARRASRRLLLYGANQDLCELIALCGLEAMLPTAPSDLQPFGQAEQREQCGGVQKEAEADDPAV